MKFVGSWAVTTMSLLVCFGSHAATDPFSNGDFADTSLAGGLGWYDASVPIGKAEILSTSPLSTLDGNYADLGGTSSEPGAIEQTFNGLSAATDYVVKFWSIGAGYSFVASNYRLLDPGYQDGSGRASLADRSAVLSVADAADGTSKQFTFASADWTEFAYSFNTGAYGEDHVWDLFFKSGSESMRLDNVSIQPLATVVPEPESYTMMLVGLGALGFMARRRKTN